MRVGCIGVGVMGNPMARRLHAAGHALFVHDVDPKACAALADIGVTPLDSPAAVARSAETLILSVPGPREVDDVMNAPQGVFAGVSPGALVIETSTIGPAQTRALHARAGALGVDFVDAPVSGGVASARSGELTAMVGGDAAAFRRALPILQCVATRVHHLGPSGSGHIAKVINQMIYLSYTALFCEAAAVGTRSGLDTRTLVEVLRSSVAGRPLMTNWERRIESGDLSPGFRVTRVLKDLALGEAYCREEGFDTPIFDGVIEAYRRLVELGHADHDLVAMYAAACNTAKGGRPE